MMPTEQQEGEVLAAYCHVKRYDFTHVPNETGSDPRARARAVRMKRAGVSKGFPDYLIFANGKRFAIELKRQKGSKTSPEQLQWLEVLKTYGFNVKVCKGAQEAIDFLEAR